MRHRSRFACAFAAAVTAACPACAKTIKLPEAAPQVMFDVPDEWTETPTGDGLELAPPDKSALLIVGLVKRDRAALTRWQKGATRRMEAFGISFDPKARTPARVAAAPTTLFSGAPSIGTPEQGPRASTAFDDKANAGLPLEDLTGVAPKSAKLRFNALVLYGASYRGEAVDAEFLDTALSPKQVFLLQQESGKTDERIGAIIDTVRRPTR